MTDPVDEFAIPHLGQYKGKSLQAADRGEVKAADGAIPADVTEQYAALIAAIKAALPEVADVRLTRRLTESAACLVADAGALSAHLERLLRRAGEDGPGSKRVLELNPDNPAVAAVRDLHARAPADPRVGAYARLLYEQAVVAEGSRIADPAGFAKRLNELIAATAAG